jgi:putative membrane protein
VRRGGGGVACEDSGVRNIIVKIVVNAVAIWVATLVVPHVDVTGESTTNKIISLLVVGALFGVVNAFIKPVVKVFALPFYILTLGLFALVVNAAMLKIVDWLSGKIGIEFSSGPFFWSTIGAALVVTLVSMVLNVVLPDKD